MSSAETMPDVWPPPFEEGEVRVGSSSPRPCGHNVRVCLPCWFSKGVWSGNRGHTCVAPATCVLTVMPLRSHGLLLHSLCCLSAGDDNFMVAVQSATSITGTDSGHDH